MRPPFTSLFCQPIKIRSFHRSSQTSLSGWVKIASTSSGLGRRCSNNDASERKHTVGMTIMWFFIWAFKGRMVITGSSTVRSCIEGCSRGRLTSSKASLLAVCVASLSSGSTFPPGSACSLWLWSATLYYWLLNKEWFFTVWDGCLRSVFALVVNKTCSLSSVSLWNKTTRTAACFTMPKSCTEFES